MILNTKHGRWAILTIGRLSFHVTRYFWLIGWQRDDDEGYRPTLRVDW